MDPRLAALLVVLPTLLAGCTGPVPSVTAAWIEGHEDRDPAMVACEWSPSHRVDPANRTIHYRPEEAPDLLGASRIVAVSVTADGGCPAAWGLHPDPGVVSVETLNVTVSEDGRVEAENETRERTLEPGESWKTSYSMTRPLDGEGENGSATRYRNATVTVHALGEWPRTGLRPDL